MWTAKCLLAAEPRGTWAAARKLQAAGMVRMGVILEQQPANLQSMRVCALVRATSSTEWATKTDFVTRL